MVFQKGNIPWIKGRKASIESKLKMSLSAKRRSQTKEARKKLGIPNIGNKYNLGRHPGKEVREKISNTLKGRYGGNKNPAWRGGICINDNGYILIYSPEHPNKRKSRPYVPQSHLVIEKYLGRYVLPTEVVHHINGDKIDNRIENLMVLSRKEHASYHHKQEVS